MQPDTVDAETFRLAVGRVLGWQVLKSSLYTMERTARGYRFTGRGRGHGVGLCVTGAGLLATRGRNARQILSQYFPGATVEARPATPGVRLVLPSLDEAERASLTAMADAAYASLARTLKVRGADVTVRFHASANSYTRASGRPWWTAGATTNGRVEMMPLAALRERGILERTLRHELVHVLTAGELSDRPRWVSEGLATRLADPGAPRSAGEAACPADAEFASAPSAATLAAIYERAAACVAREWDRHAGDWREFGSSTATPTR
jgi:hypothetical protein